MIQNDAYHVVKPRINQQMGMIFTPTDGKKTSKYQGPFFVGQSSCHHPGWITKAQGTLGHVHGEGPQNDTLYMSVFLRKKHDHHTRAFVFCFGDGKPVLPIVRGPNYRNHSQLGFYCVSMGFNIVFPQQRKLGVFSQSEGPGAGQVPKQGSQEQVAHAAQNSCPRTTSQARPRRTAASKVTSKNRIPSKITKNRFPSKVPENRCHVKHGSQASSAGTGFQETGSQARFSRTGAQARFQRIVNRLLQSLIFSSHGTERLKK